MKEKTRKISVNKLSKRRPYQRLDDGGKKAIVKLINEGAISILGASQRYKIPRNSIKKWLRAELVDNLVREAPNLQENILFSRMSKSSTDQELLQQLRTVVKELEQSKLKVAALETMIVVAEEEFKIKIRKKRGTKQSRECDKATTR